MSERIQHTGGEGRDGRANAQTSNAVRAQPHTDTGPTASTLPPAAAADGGTTSLAVTEPPLRCSTRIASPPRSCIMVSVRVYGRYPSQRGPGRATQSAERRCWCCSIVRGSEEMADATPALQRVFRQYGSDTGAVGVATTDRRPAVASQQPKVDATHARVTLGAVPPERRPPS